MTAAKKVRDRDRTETRWTRDRYRRPAERVARELLGQTLCRRVAPRVVLRGRVVELEIYDGTDDRASHAHRGPTPRNAPMFEAGGVAYVYLVYGIHHCLNVVTGEAGRPGAILVRAADVGVPGAARGPGKLAAHFAIDRRDDGVSLAGRSLWFEHAPPVPDAAVLRTRRIGVDYAGAWADAPLRLAVDGHPEVSGPAALRRSAAVSNIRRRRRTTSTRSP